MFWIVALAQFLAAMITPFLFGSGVILMALVFVATVELNRHMWLDYMDYYFSGDFDSYEEACQRAKKLGEISILGLSVMRFMSSYQFPEASDEHFYMTGAEGEAELARVYGGESHVYFKTSLGGRYVDQYANDVAHESKVGYTTLTSRIRTQILKDAELIKFWRCNNAYKQK